MAENPKHSDYEPAQDSRALFYDVSPKVVLGVRVLGAVTMAMVIIAFIICLAKGVDNGTFYLLACNLVISSVVGSVIGWWYRKGDLGVEKYWFVALLCGVILFQCVTTDIFVFNVTKHRPVSPTVLPHNQTTVTAINMTTTMTTYRPAQALL